MKMRATLILLGLTAMLAFCLLWLPACPVRYEIAVRSAIESSPYVSDFERLYPEAVHSITHYTGTHGPQMWNSKVGLHGRYVLTMQMDITLNAYGTSIVSYSEPRFVLNEVTRLHSLNSGQVVIDYHGVSKQFGPTEWKKIVDQDGDLAALEIEIKKGRPISGFDEHWHGG